MHRIDTDGAVNNQFVDPDPTIGQEGTLVDDAWLNDVQETLANPIEATGATLQKGVFTQLTTAIRALAAAAASNLLGLANTWTAAQMFNSGVSVSGLGQVGQVEFPGGSGASFYNAGWRNDGASLYLLLSNVQTSLALARNGSFNALRPFSVNTSTGAVSIDQSGAGVTFAGSVTVSGTLNATVSAAAKLATGRTITFSGGDVAGTTSAFDGSTNLTNQTLTLATVNANTGNWGSAAAFSVPSLTVDGKGRVTAASAATIPTMGGDGGSGGAKGLVPAPPAGAAAAGDVLGAGGGWVHPAGGFFESAEIPLSTNATGLVAHGLSAQPKRVWAVLRCKVANNGFSVGEEIEDFGYSETNSTPQGGRSILVSSVDATNVRYVFPAAVNSLSVSSAGSVVTLTSGNWVLVIRATVNF